MFPLISQSIMEMIPHCKISLSIPDYFDVEFITIVYVQEIRNYIIALIDLRNDCTTK